MIPRYSRPEMTQIWSDEVKYAIWLKIETYACEAQAELGIIPKSAAKIIAEKGNFNVKNIEKIEAKCKHDVIAFLTNLAEYVGDEARFIHQGLTSSDVLDTALSVQLMRSTDILLQDLKTLLEALQKKAEQYKSTPMIGRSHGIHAEPISFGLKLASHYAEFQRDYNRLKAVQKEISVCAISGAVGTFANISPKVESYVAEKLGLSVEPISTQIICRDRHAMLSCVLAVIAGSIERLSITIRLMQSSEVNEAEEFFSSNQKGSSAMPHKRNPILTENLVGLCRMIRAGCLPSLENQALWHERDISHSSVERQMLPDSLVLLDFALHRLSKVIDGLVINESQMVKNLDNSGGLYNSQRVLLALTQEGVSREDAYIWVQRNAMKSWSGDGNFCELLKNDEDIIACLSADKIDACFDLSYHLRYVDEIFERVFKNKT